MATTHGLRPRGKAIPEYWVWVNMRRRIVEEWPIELALTLPSQRGKRAPPRTST